MRKGISQVITSTIILAVAIAVAGVYANWAPDFAEVLGQDVAEDTQNDMACRNVAINLEYAEYDLSGNFTEVQVTNTGTINLFEGLQAASIRNSAIQNTTDINELEVDETTIFRINSPRVPETVLISSRDCPSEEISADQIETTE
ncbi:hypothetical protein GLU60_00875 [Nanohaloarchaea archaeon H01]|nr:hypothetical protein [Nanohaloarchaea archaeon H01]